MLVMVLALSVLAIAAPRLDRFSRGRVLVAHAEIALSLLQTARDRSAAEAVAYRLDVDPDRGTFGLSRQTGGTFAPEGDSSGRRHVLPDGIMIELERLDTADNASFIEFRPTGECTPANLKLTDKGRETVRLVCRAPLEAFMLVQGDQEGSP
jgi:Tfp pilus assembly protein FimT